MKQPGFDRALPEIDAALEFLGIARTDLTASDQQFVELAVGRRANDQDDRILRRTVLARSIALILGVIEHPWLERGQRSRGRWAWRGRKDRRSDDD